MKTMITSIRIVGTLLTVAVLFTCSSSAWARAVAAGDFVLPFDVQWNGATLPAGQYHFTLQSGEFAGLLQIRDGQQNGKMLAVAVGTSPAPDHSRMTIVRRKGKWNVASLALEPVGTTLEYRVPAQTEAETETEALVQVIPVRIVKS